MPAYVPPSYANTIAPVPPPRSPAERARLRRLVVERLNDNPRTGSWFEAVTAAVAFHEREGHLVVPRFHVENGYDLGGFIHNTRNRYLCSRPSKDKLDEEQVRIMEALGMVWRVNNARFANVYVPAEDPDVIAVQEIIADGPDSTAKRPGAVRGLRRLADAVQRRCDVDGQPAVAVGGIMHHTGLLWRDGIHPVPGSDVDSVFVKGLPVADRRARRQEREAAVSQLVDDVGPRVRWHLPDVAGWNLLGVDAVNRARHADLRPGSPDLPEVTWRVAWELGRRRPGRRVVDERIERRWAEYGDPADLALLAGEQVLRTDLRPDNLLVGVDGRVWPVDWAWPTLGAAWLDPAIVTLWMIAHGHTVEEAQEWFRAGPAGQRASASAVSAYCRIAARQWAVIADQDPAPRKRQLADAAAGWRAHRRA